MEVSSKYIKKIMKCKISYYLDKIFNNSDKLMKVEKGFINGESNSCINKWKDLDKV